MFVCTCLFTFICAPAYIYVCVYLSVSLYNLCNCLSVCMYVHISMYVCCTCLSVFMFYVTVSLYVCICLYVCIYLSIWMYMLAYMYVCTYIPVCLHVYVSLSVCMFVCVCMHGPICVHVNVHPSFFMSIRLPFYVYVPFTFPHTIPDKPEKTPPHPTRSNIHLTLVLLGKMYWVVNAAKTTAMLAWFKQMPCLYLLGVSKLVLVFFSVTS